MTEDKTVPAPTQTVRRPQLGKLAKAGGIAGILKLAGAGLSYLLLVAIAQVTDDRQFGYFGAAFSLANLVAFVGTVGQQSVVLRFWPEWSGKGNIPLARAFLARSFVIALVGIAATSVLVVAVGYVIVAMGSESVWVGVCLSAAVLAAAISVAEVLSSSSRARGYLIQALLPRDVTWRVLAIAVVAVIGFSWRPIDAAAAMYIVGGALWIALAAQIFSEAVHAFTGERVSLTDAHKVTHRQVTLGVWATTALTPALSQMTTLVVAIVLGPEWAGAVFAADRTARLISIALKGVNQVLAPQISKAYHTGNVARVQQITAVTSLFSLAVGMACLVFFLIFGGRVMRAFDAAYDTATVYWVLIIIAAGQVVNAAAGPTGWLLQMTGRERALLMQLVISNVIGFSVMLTLIQVWGAIGAAIGISITTILTNVLSVIDAKRNLGIDPSVINYLRRGRRD